MKKIKSSQNKPRLSVFRSNRSIYAQIIDDDKGKTLVAAGEREIKETDKKMTKRERAQKLGEILAGKALKKGLKRIVFDRGRYRYHGRVRALAEGARKGGLKF